MPLCTSCAYPTDHLYTTYSTPSNIRLTVCTRCGQFADPLIEHPPLLLLLDLVLLKPRVYLHLLFNRGHPPKDGARTASAVSSTGDPDRRDALWTAWTKLALATMATEIATRIISLNTDSRTILGLIPRLAASVMAEMFVQHLVTTLLALAAIRLRGWWCRDSKAEMSDGRQTLFRPVMISLTLLYTTLLPLVLQLALGIWYTFEHEPHSVRPSITSAVPDSILNTLPHTARNPVITMGEGLWQAWNETDRIWMGTRLLGGMAAGFGLRVILPTRPLETVAIVLAGWAAATQIGRTS